LDGKFVSKDLLQIGGLVFLEKGHLYWIGG
jgi:hypothetical protein